MQCGQCVCEQVQMCGEWDQVADVHAGRGGGVPAGVGVCVS